MNYIFDIDGTLTPSRGKINKDFQDKFYKWMVSTKKSGDNVYFITGSDKDKTIEQIGKRIWKTATQCYQSCGNAVYENGKLIHQIDFAFTNELRELLNNFLEGSPMYGKYTTNIEERIGLINFSVIGRSCTQSVRKEYYEWDKLSNERKQFCNEIMHRFPYIEASVGGEISIDIHTKGKNKSQILEHVQGAVTFFGDRCDKGGNDYPIVEYLRTAQFGSHGAREYTIHEVKDWQDTKLRLKI